MTRKKTSTAEAMQHLRSKIATADRSVCWPWPFGRVTAGYGIVGNPQRRLSHVAMEEDGNPWHAPLGFNALHSCDNPPCFNPDHLSWGTNKLNMQERGDRGRHGSTVRSVAEGTKKPKRFLSQEEREALRAEYVPGKWGNSKMLMEKYGVSQPTLNRIARNESFSRDCTCTNGRCAKCRTAVSKE